MKTDQSFIEEHALIHVIRLVIRDKEYGICRRERKVMKKRIGSVLLVFVLVTAAFTLPVSAFTQRKSAPADSNQYYYSNKNPFYPAYVGQCTWYAWGRAYEVSGKRPALSTQNAGKWYSANDGYKHDTTPKAGSVVCWLAGQGGSDATTGHVAFVESVNSDGSVFISEFNWGNHPLAFGTRTLKKGTSAYNTARYIHIIDPSADNDDPPPVSKTQNVNPGVYNIKNVASGRYMNYAWGWKAFNYYPIMICDKDNSPEQKFELQHMGSGQYMLIIKHKDGGVVNIWRGSGSAQAGDPVSQYARNNSDPLQKFYFTKLSNGNYIIRCATDPGKVIAPESTGNQAYLKVFAYKANDTKQQWVLSEIHTHSLVHKDRKDAICEQAGNAEYWTCSSCGKLFRDSEGKTEIRKEDTVIPATGHKWSEWTVIRPATGTETGIESRSCSNCGKTETREIPVRLSENPFTDVRDSDYFYDSVLWAVSHDPQITKGTSGTTFSPEDTCTRGQAVTFLWRACGCEKVTDAENPFTDVKSSDFFYDAVLWAYQNKITTGTAATTFGSEETCDRGQIVTFLWRSQGEPAATASISFNDVADDAYYYAPVRWAVEKGITKGTTDKTFSPFDSCKRGQIVTFLYRAVS